MWVRMRKGLIAPCITFSSFLKIKAYVCDRANTAIHFIVICDRNISSSDRTFWKLKIRGELRVTHIFRCHYWLSIPFHGDRNGNILSYILPTIKSA